MHKKLYAYEKYFLIVLKMERETRLELATVCLEGRSSSQLSYSRSIVVRMRRLELPHREAPDPKSGVSTNFTTSAIIFLKKNV